MANQKQKFILCVVLLAITTSTTSLELDQETKEKITELVGEKQIILRRYLDGIKSHTDKFEHKITRITAEAKDSLWQEVNKTIDGIKNHAGKPENTECTNQKNQGIDEITTQFETTHTNCVSSTKPDIVELFRDIYKFAELQSKIGNTPKTCMDSNNDVDSLLKCIKKLLDDIEKEMVDGHNQINNKIQQVDKQVNGLENSLNSCQNNELGIIQKKANEIKEQFDECVKS